MAPATRIRPQRAAAAKKPRYTFDTEESETLVDPSPDADSMNIYKAANVSESGRESSLRNPSDKSVMSNDETEPEYASAKLGIKRKRITLIFKTQNSEVPGTEQGKPQKAMASHPKLIKAKPKPKPLKKTTKSSGKKAQPQADDDVDMTDIAESSEEAASSVIFEEPDSEDEDGNVTKASITKDPYKYSEGIAQGSKPIASIEGMLQDMFEKFIDMAKLNKADTLPLKVATVCSGTDIPVLVLDMVAKYLHLRQTQGEEKSFTLLVDHMFSAEIVAWKQAYIQRNCKPPFLFRNITEFLKEVATGEAQKATTAFGSREIVPTQPDFLIAGFCCVDFSVLNVCPKSLAALGESGDTFHSIMAYLALHSPKIVILENVVGAPWYDAKVTAKQKQKYVNGAVKAAVAELLAKLQKDDPEAEVTVDMESEIIERQTEFMETNTTLSRGIDYHLDKVGYMCTHVSVDTKDYYIPQTRQRGYLVAINYKKFAETMPGATNEQVKVKINKSMDHWKCLMKKFESPASVPVEAMLVAAEDDSQPFMSRMEELESEDKKIPPWDKCKVNHVKYRLVNGFGSDHKLTYWLDNGFRKNPDHWAYLKGMTDRVADALEISHLRSIARGLDDRFYHRYLELSQNVYRIHDSTKNGLIGCLTPNGIPFWTFKGRRISGREALILQGLPVKSLDLSHLTDSQLQQLSGNAMTSTVVAAAMFSAIIAFKRLLTTHRDSLMSVDKPQFDPVPGMLEKEIDPRAVKKPMPVKYAKMMAAETVSLCYCEGRHNKLDKIFLRCEVCRHTGCSECTGNPTHSFERIKEAAINDRKLPASFESQLQNALPTYIQFSQLGDVIKSIAKKYPHANAVSWGILEAYYKAALSSDLFLKKISRGEAWEAIYMSPQAKLVLTISSTRVQWLLYAVPNSDLGITHPIRVFLEAQPIARLLPVGGDITQGEWNVFVPNYQLVKATITSSGSLNQSYESFIGLHEHRDQYVFNRCSVAVQPGDAQLFETDITGDYEAHQPCGQAFGSLHVKTSTKNDETPLYFFLDHDKQRGDPWSHQYVFTHDSRRQRPMEQRALIGKLAPLSPFPFQTNNGQEVPRNLSWRQPKVKHQVVGGISENKYQFRKSCTANSKFEDILDEIHKFEIIDHVMVVVPGSWAKSDLSINPRREPLVFYKQVPVNSPSFIINNSCIGSKSIFECRAKIPNYTALRYPLNEIIRLGPANQLQVMQDLLWILKPVLSIPGYSVTDVEWHSFALSSHVTSCQDCAPDRPQLYWAVNKRAKTAKQEPYELPQMAAAYEKSLKSRPNSVNLDFFVGRVDEENDEHCMKNNNGCIPIVNVQISVNFGTLVHRALFDLEPSGNMRGIKAAISLVTDEINEPLKPFEPFTFPDSKEFEKNARKNGFKNFNKFQLSGSYKLRPEQCRSVAWQISQENTRPKFLEEIVVEEQTKFGYRASAKVSRSVSVGGGCLFHPVGFGKTAVVLGLVSKQKKSDTTRAEAAMKKFSGYIPLKATLIIMSCQLINQWKEEVFKFLDPQEKKAILVINSTPQWKSHSIKDFQQAWIVIVNWNILEHPQYLDHLAQFGGMLGMEANPSSRGHASFHKSVMARICTNIDILRSQPSNFENLVNQQIDQNINDIDNNIKPVPSKRVTGTAYQEAKAGMKGKKGKGGKNSKKDKGGEKGKKAIEEPPIHLPKGPRQGASWDSTKGVPLEAFDWSRLVVDEFPYMTDSANATVTNIKKRNLWLVSATPQLHDFEMVRQVASKFGVNLGIKDYTLMAPDVWKKSSAAMTDSETFLAYDRPRSAVWYESRNTVARRFIKKFAICDQPSYDQIIFSEVIKMCFAPATQMAASQELMQCLAVTEKGSLQQKTLGSGNQALQIKEAFGGSKTAVQALLKQASYFNHCADPGFVSAQTANPISAVRTTVACRNNSLTFQTSKFTSRLQEVVWLAAHKDAGNGKEKLRAFVDCLEGNYWGDKGLCAKIQTFISAAFAISGNNTKAFEASMKKKYPKGAREAINGKDQPKVQATLRNFVRDLTQVVDEIVKQTRAHRFMEAVRICQRQGVSPANCNRCGQNFPLKEITVLSGCGHMACNKCLFKEDLCPANGCKSGRESYRITLGNLFAIPGTNDDVSRFGQKAEDLVELINSIPDNEKALLFVQSEFLIKTVEELLKERGIPRGTLNSKLESQSALSKFQKGIGNRKVLILNIASESAAGCNLTMASHVIFYAPFMTTGSNGFSTYDTAMKQAIGRAVRYGQKADCVKVYHLMTAYTADVDVYEHRKKMIVYNNQATGNYELRDRADQELFGKYSSCVPHLVHNAGGAYGV